MEAGAGLYLLRIGEDGQITLSPLRVIRPTGTPTEPDPPQDPVDEDLRAFETAVRALPLISTTEERQAISKLYRSVAGLSQLSSADQLRQATDVLFLAAVGETSSPESWRSWKVGADQAAEGFSLEKLKRAWLVVAKTLQ